MLLMCDCPEAASGQETGTFPGEAVMGMQVIFVTISIIYGYVYFKNFI